MAQQQSQEMTYSSGEKAGYAICLFLTILLVGLHIAVVTEGYIYYRDLHDLNQDPLKSQNLYLDLKGQKQEMSFVIIAAGLTFFISIALLIGLYTEVFSARAKHILAALNLILEFAIAVVISLKASDLSNYRDAYPQNDVGTFTTYYRLSIADAVITFALEVVYLFFIFLGTLNENINKVLVTPVVAEVPPLSNRQF